jgi:hypothetical protein
MWSVAPILSAAMVGVWLQLSIFLWPHSYGQAALALVGGPCCPSPGERASRNRPWAVENAALPGG